MRWLSWSTEAILEEAVHTEAGDAVGLLRKLSKIFPPEMTILLSMHKINPQWVVEDAKTLTLRSVWVKCCSGNTHQHHKTHPRWRSRRSLALSVRAGGCELARRRRCWGRTGHSLMDQKHKADIRVGMMEGSALFMMDKSTGRGASSTQKH